MNSFDFFNEKLNEDHLLHILRKQLQRCSTRKEDFFILCEVCGANITPEIYDMHLENCEGSIDTEGILCEFCNLKYSLKGYEFHLDSCIDNYKGPNIDCDYCKYSFDIEAYDMHVMVCKNQQKKGTEKESVDEECVICLQKFEGSEETKYLECFHRFHTECILDWAKKKSKCPICQTQFSASMLLRKN